MVVCNNTESIEIVQNISERASVSVIIFNFTNISIKNIITWY